MRDQDVKRIAAGLLDWYDHHARDLPWRVSPAERAAGVVPDPYRVWLSEIMLQQTTVAAVTDYFHKFSGLWPNVEALARARDGDVMAAWAGLGYYARARNLLKCARVVAFDLDGRFPDTYPGLIALPGIGPYTAAAICAIAFDRQETVLDGNVERVMARFYDLHDPLPASKPLLRTHAEALTPATRPGDYAQAVMDLGATICTPRSPACGICPLRPDCAARMSGTASELPKKSPKRPKPTKRGIAYLARTTEGGWILERRPDKGLLGGMLGWPGPDWEETPSDLPPFDADWRDFPGEVRHTFTHFHLILKLRIATIATERVRGGYKVIPRHELRPSDLPTVMRKAHDLVRGH